MIARPPEQLEKNRTENVDIIPIIDQLINYSAGDFEDRLEISPEMSDHEKALITGINILGEELQYNMVKKKFFETIFENSHEANMILDNKFKIEERNSVCEKLFNKCKGLEEKFIEFLGQKIEEEQLNKNCEFAFVDEEQSINLRVIMSALSNDKNKYFIAIHDITEIKDKERDKTQSILYTQERVRQRVANDLHDSLGQELNALHMFLQAFKNTPEKKKNERDKLIQYMEELVQSSIKTCKSVTSDLLPAALENGNLIDAVEFLKSSLNSSQNVEIKFFNSVNSVSNIEKQDQVHMFRILQEFINNSLKHSKCTSIHIYFEEHDSKLAVKVMDDGIGFDKNSIKRNNGLNNITTRLEYLKKEYVFNSIPELGTYLFFC